jgi:hypothetical protein
MQLILHALMAYENYSAHFCEDRNEALRTVLQLVSSLPQTFDAFQSFDINLGP